MSNYWNASLPPRYIDFDGTPIPAPGSGEEMSYGYQVYIAKNEGGYRCGTSKKCFVFPVCALVGIAFTGTSALLGWQTGNERDLEMAKYAGMATAAVVGTSIIATLGASLVEGCEDGCDAASDVWERSCCSFGKPAGIFVNTLSAIFPPAWFCWCRR